MLHPLLYKISYEFEGGMIPLHASAPFLLPRGLRNETTDVTKESLGGLPVTVDSQTFGSTRGAPSGRKFESLLQQFEALLEGESL